MKRLCLVLLAVLLGACSAAPTQAPVQPVAQEPVVVTVVVQPTQAPPEPVVVTVVVPASPIPPTEAPPPTAIPAATTGAQTTGGPIPIDDILGKGVFINMTMSGNEFSLRCLPRDITFNITSNLQDIVDAELDYRIVDQPKALYYSEWKRAGVMEKDKKGNFWVTFSGEDVDSSLRLDFAWFEFQFIGLNKGGGVVDRTQKIEKLVTYRIDCP